MENAIKSPVELPSISFHHEFTVRETDHLKEWSNACNYEMVQVNPQCFKIINNTVIPVTDDQGNQLFTRKGNPIMRAIHREGMIRKVRHYYDSEGQIKEYFTVEYISNRKTFKLNGNEVATDKKGNKLSFRYTYREDLSHLFGTNKVVNKINDIFKGKLDSIWLILDLEPEEIKQNIPMLPRGRYTKAI